MQPIRNAAMPIRRFECKLTVDFVVEIDSINEDSVHDLAQDYSNRDEVVRDPETWAWVNRQRRLLSAFLKRPDLLHRYVEDGARFAAIEEVASWVGAVLDYERDSEGAEDAWWEAVRTLGDDDQAFFEASARERLVYEETEVFERAFRYRPTNVSLEVGEET